MAALVEWGGQNLGPGRIVRDTEGPVVVGELDGEERPRTRLLAEALGLAGETRITRNARGMIWSKLLVNSAFTGLSAVSGLRYGGVAEHPAGREAVLGLWREGYDVGRAEGLELDRVFDMEPEEMLADGPRGRARGRGGARSLDGPVGTGAPLHAPGPPAGAPHRGRRGERRRGRARAGARRAHAPERPRRRRSCTPWSAASAGRSQPRSRRWPALLP